MKKTAVLGSGSWGTALATVLNKNGHDVKLWSYNKEEADLINNKHKCKFLPNIEVPSSILCFTSLEENKNAKERRSKTEISSISCN